MGESENGPIVGIDLGTTNSVVAGIVDGKVVVLAEDGQQIFPSVVGLDASGKMITGDVARNQLAAFPDRTIASVKRKMGTDEEVSLGDQAFSPQEISAMILRRLRDRASRVLGESVERAVITVPAFFDEKQRHATREAGVLAGLKVERIINEPTAATLVYHADSEVQQHVVVYDFGGGTFDVSVVRFEMGVVEVLSSKGDTQLGGDDLDELLLNHVAVDFYKQHKIDLRDDLATRYRLLHACEAAKKSLSEVASVEIAEEFIVEKDGQPLNLTMTITRNDFEKLIQPLVDQTLGSVDAALRESGLSIGSIDDLVLVGGSTRIPLVAQRLREELQVEPSRAVDPDLAVALGAATQAAMFDGHSIGPVLIDISGHTLGLEVMTGFDGPSPKLVFSPIIRRNSPLPATYEEVYTRMHEDQEQVDIHVLQGESSELARNQSIGRFMLALETGSDISDEIKVRFDLTLDGILKVTATQSATGKSGEMVIDNALSQVQPEDRDQVEARLGEMFDASSEIMPGANHVKRDLKARPAASKPNLSIPNLKKYPAAAAMLEQCQAVVGVPAEDLREVKSVAKKLRAAITEDNNVRVTSLCEELDDILFYLQG